MADRDDIPVRRDHGMGVEVAFDSPECRRFGSAPQGVPRLMVEIDDGCPVMVVAAPPVVEQVFQGSWWDAALLETNSGVIGGLAHGVPDRSVDDGFHARCGQAHQVSLSGLVVLQAGRDFIGLLFAEGIS